MCLGQCQQAGVTTDLAQLEQGIQNLDLRMRQALVAEGIAHGFFGAQANGLVQVSLAIAELYTGNRHLLFRQITRHVALVAAQHEGGHALAQALCALVVLVFFNRCAVQRPKARLAAQKTRH